MVETSLGVFGVSLERAITGSISKAIKNEWLEDSLTLSWLRAVRPLLDGAHLHSRGMHRFVTSRLFKLKGAIEHDHGDVALLVKLQFDDGESLSGVGFLEAKKRAWDDASFPALKVSQLKRQYGRTRRAHVLFYDRTPSAFGAGCVENHWPDEFASHTKTSHALAVPMDILLDDTKHSPTVYRYAGPLSCLIAHRYLLGQDLDFRPKVIEAATNFANREEVSTMVLSVGVRVSAVDDGQPEQSTRSEEPPEGFEAIW